MTSVHSTYCTDLNKEKNKYEIHTPRHPCTCVDLNVPRFQNLVYSERHPCTRKMIKLTPSVNHFTLETSVRCDSVKFEGIISFYCLIIIFKSPTYVTKVQQHLNLRKLQTTRHFDFCHHVLCSQA